MREWIPLSTPSLEGNEWSYIKDCLDTGWVSSVGQYVNRFEEEIQGYTGAKFAVATMNGTSALHIALLLAGVQQGDIVLLPSLTFVATANAVSYTGATPVLVDADPRTWQMDLNLLQKFLDTETEQREGQCFLQNTGQRVGAIVPVHVLGGLVDMDSLMELAGRYHIPVVEDSTEALGSTLNGKHAGTMGMLGTLSFNGNKMITTGGGGMILTNDPLLAKRAKHLTTQAKADALEYYHDEIGFNYRLVNVLAAMGVAQMEKLPDFLHSHSRIYQAYRNGLSFLPETAWQESLVGANPNYWLTTVCFPQAEQLLVYLLDHKIQARKFWVPMHRLPMFSQSRYLQDHEVATQLYQTAISLPSSSHLSEEDQTYIIQTIRSFYGQA